VCEIEKRFSDCLDTDHSAGRSNGMSGMLVGKNQTKANVSTAAGGGEKANNPTSPFRGAPVWEIMLTN
jgi:hypothetical protein